MVMYLEYPFQSLGSVWVEKITHITSHVYAESTQENKNTAKCTHQIDLLIQIMILFKVYQGKKERKGKQKTRRLI